MKESNVRVPLKGSWICRCGLLLSPWDNSCLRCGFKMIHSIWQA